MTMDETQNRILFYIMIMITILTNHKTCKWDVETFAIYRCSSTHMTASDGMKKDYSFKNRLEETTNEHLNKTVRDQPVATECTSCCNRNVGTEKINYINRSRTNRSTEKFIQRIYHQRSNATRKKMRNILMKVDDSIHLLDVKPHCVERKNPSLSNYFLFLAFIIAFVCFIEKHYLKHKMNIRCVPYRIIKPCDISYFVPLKVKIESDFLLNSLSTFFTKKVTLHVCVSVNAKHADTTDTAYFGDVSLNKRNAFYDFLFGFRQSTYVTLNVYPTSLDKYFDDVSKNNPIKRDLMKYEWARYESFRNFPKTSVMMPMRLAQAGFFYNGLGEEVTCFCCGIRNRVWNSGETAFRVHERISPNCSFILGEENRNVSIHTSDAEYKGMDNNKNTKQRNEKHDTGANGGPDDIQVVIKEAISKLEQSQITESTGDGTYEINNPAPKIRNVSPEGINFKCAKHPEYGVKMVRTSSYIRWPSHHTQTPEELSDAGFYYAGFQDCVRCFFCGGGLKNWEYGDGPWTEHARWYPNCAYLKHCKGEAFISQYREDKQDVKESEVTRGTPANATASSGKANATQDEKHRPEELIYAPNTPNSDITSAAAESVLEMGYDTVTLQHAIEIFRMHHGDTRLTAEALMQILLDDVHSHVSEEHQHNHTRENSTAPDHNTAVSTIKIPDSQRQRVSHSSSNSGILNKTDETKPHAKSTLAKEDYKSIAEENRSLREQMMCKICMDNDACIVFLPCGHMLACPECAPALRKCAICRQLIKGTIRVFPS